MTMTCSSRSWWLRSGYLARSESDAAQALDWAHGAVHGRMRSDDMQGTVLLVDRLLDAPGAVPQIAADNILNGLLTNRGPEVAPMIAGLAARHPCWQITLQATDLDPHHRDAVPELSPYLPDPR